MGMEPKNIEGRILSLKESLGGARDWEEKYKRIIDMGKGMPAFPEEHRSEGNKVRGCQSQVWLHAYEENGRVRFRGDSDASIVKGLVALLLSVYDDSTPEEILATRPVFLEELGLKQHLSMSRANGLNAMMKQILIYAMAFKARAQMGTR